jgi:bis(5'-adenosyl)-triphosphatase
MPVRSVPYLEDLTPVEYDDLWRAVRESQRILRLHYSFSSSPSNDEHEEEEQMRTSKEQRCPLGFNVAVQDGPQAGQSVPHVHVHILPRVSGDLERNDDVYEALELWSPRRPPTAADSVSSRARLEVADDDQRRDRTLDEMAQEAALYRSYL